MSYWKYTLRVGRDRAAYDAGEITLHELGKRFAQKIRELPCYGKEESLFSSTDELDHVSDVEDFDNILEALYDWGDTALDDNWPRTKMCWIEPMSKMDGQEQSASTLADQQGHENDLRFESRQDYENLEHAGNPPEYQE